MWLKYFQYGPMEWIWRQLTYGKRLPLRKDRHHSKKMFEDVTNEAATGKKIRTSIY
jgi:hypothetical protein